jgi:hypothetical protein
MPSHLSSAKSAKDKRSLSNLDDLDLAMKTDSRFNNHLEYDPVKAEIRHAKRKHIMEPQPKLRLSKYGLFIAGLTAGAAFTGLIAFVIRTTGPGAGLALVIGTAITLGVIGVQMGDDE